MNTRTLILLALLAAGRVLAAGPETIQPDTQRIAKTYYVSITTGSDEDGNGSASRPWASVSHAIERAKGRSVAILVAEGVYAENSLTLRDELELYGGYSAADWSRDIKKHRSTLDASGAGRLVAAIGNARIDGFELRGGQVRGPGAAVLIDGTSPTLSNNVFTSNKTLGPENWAPEHWHETANDGGAVYCTNGGEPRILNNVFAGNQTENGRGGGLAYDGRCAGQISGNVFFRNTAGLDDPMRSSDGGAISIFRWSSPEITDNVILSNAALNRNDGGGVFVALWSSANIRNNTIVANQAGDDAGGLFVGGQEHRYDEPLDPLPDADEFFVEIVGNRFFGNQNSSFNSGATRITMETRGRVANNIAALNSGFYLQRSELAVENNTILENTLLIETKDGLKPSEFVNNIVLGSFEFEPVADVRNSLFRDGLEGNEQGTPVFLKDGQTFALLSVSYAKSEFQTRVHVAGDVVGPPLKGRVVVAGQSWGVIESVEGNAMTIWGDLKTATEMRVLPSYRQTTSSPGFGKGADASRAENRAWVPKRINKSIELLERGQPIYYASGSGGYLDGLAMASTWGDYILYNMEHPPLDFHNLREFMRGLVDAGPTPSGHRTPTVIVVLPLLGLDEESVRVGGWMVEQALAQGVHGVHLARARDPEAVKRFVQAARYPVHKQEIDTLGEGLRGWGSHIFAAWVWGLEREEYLEKADVWPLNPAGEIMLGVKIEDQQALARADETLTVPGISFAEHGPRDLGLSYGYLEGRADPPVPEEVNAAGDYVLELCQENGLFFLDNVLPDNVAGQLDRGVMVGAGRRKDSAEVGREHTKRQMPW